jgi:hypothetical protein
MNAAGHRQTLTWRLRSKAGKDQQQLGEIVALSLIRKRV